MNRGNQNAAQLGLGLQSTSNAFLIDAILVEDLVRRLKVSYDPDALSDLCGLLVEFVLRDRAYVVRFPNVDFQRHPFMQSCLESGLAYNLKPARRGIGESSPEQAVLRKHGYADVAPLIRASAYAKLPVFAVGAAHHAIETLAPRRIEHAICDLVTEYVRLEDRAIETLLKYRLVNPAYWQFRIPPLPLEILRRCKSLDDLRDATLDVRSEHTSLRRDFVEVNGLIADPHVHPRRKKKELEKLQGSLAAIARVAEGATLVSFASSGGYLLSTVTGGAQCIYGTATGDASKALRGGGRVIKNGASAARLALGDRLKAWRLEPLYQSFNQWMGTSDHTMLVHVSRLCGPPS